MFQTYSYALLSVITISLVSLVGVVTLSLKTERLTKIVIFLVALSAGALLGDTFLHLLPEVMKENLSLAPWLWVIGGMIVFFILEKIVCWRHCHMPMTETHHHSMGTMNLIGDGLHNFIDGVVVAGSFLVSIPLGVATTIAVLIHEIPQEISDFGVLMHAGFAKKKAILLNLLSASISIVGCVLTLVIGVSLVDITQYVIPFTAGGFIYIATADLLPELHKETAPHRSLAQLLSILAGIGIMYAMKVMMG